MINAIISPPARMVFSLFSRKDLITVLLKFRRDGALYVADYSEIYILLRHYVRPRKAYNSY